MRERPKTIHKGCPEKRSLPWYPVLLASIDLFGPARVLDDLDEIDVAVARNDQTRLVRHFDPSLGHE